MPRTTGSNPLRRADDPRHGTSGGYYGHGCKCEKCVTFARESQRKRREERFFEIKPEDHGKANTYMNSMCRCEPCSQAYKARTKKTTEETKARRSRSRIPKVNFSDLA